MYNYQRFIKKCVSSSLEKVWNYIRVKFGYECLDSAYLQSDMSEIHLFVADPFRIAQSAIGLPR